MAVTKISSLLTRSAARRGCPCGATGWKADNPPTVSLVMQLATLGTARRLRARAITLHCCENCIRLIHTKGGRPLRRALAEAVQAQAVDLARQKKGSNAA